MHLTCPSMIRVYDCDRSKDAVTLRLRYSLQPVCFKEHEVEVGALVSSTCFAGIRNVTNHSERNSMILASSLERRMPWTALSADSTSDPCAAVDTPTVRLAWSSAKNSRHILETHWLSFSMSMVTFARATGQAVLTGSVRAQVSVLAILLRVHLPVGGNERCLLRCLCCAVYGTGQLHAPIGLRDHVG